MHCRISTVPRGEYEGAPCLDVALNPSSTPQGVLSGVVQSRRAGFQAWYLTAAPWGQPSLDEALLLLLSHGSTANVPVIACRPLAAGEWANVEIFWQADASALFAHKISVSDLVDKIASLPFFPRLSEVMVVAPHIDNVQPALLDELYTRTDPDLGWIYAPADASAAWMARALAALTQCDTPWRLRREHEQAEEKEKAATTR